MWEDGKCIGAIDLLLIQELRAQARAGERPTLGAEYWPLHWGKWEDGYIWGDLEALPEEQRQFVKRHVSKETK